MSKPAPLCSYFLARGVKIGLAILEQSDRDRFRDGV